VANIDEASTATDSGYVPAAILPVEVSAPCLAALYLFSERKICEAPDGPRRIFFERRPFDRITGKPEMWNRPQERLGRFPVTRLIHSNISVGRVIGLLGC